MLSDGGGKPDNGWSAVCNGNDKVYLRVSLREVVAPGHVDEGIMVSISEDETHLGYLGPLSI